MFLSYVSFVATVGLTWLSQRLFQKHVDQLSPLRLGDLPCTSYGIPEHQLWRKKGLGLIAENLLQRSLQTSFDMFFGGPYWFC